MNKNIDFNYICTTISNLAGTPVRVYQNNEQIFYYSSVLLPKDPINLVLDQLLSLHKNIEYYVTKNFYYYGIVNSDDITIIIGPSTIINPTNQTLKNIAFELGCEKDDIEYFIQGMKNINPMPLESIIQMLCTLNYMINDEKLTISDFYLSEQSINTFLEKSPNTYQTSSSNNTHNTLSLEEQITSIVRNGNLEELKKLSENAPTVTPGKLAENQLRQIKNTFIVTATLVSRAAIRGGLDSNIALSMSDSYIQQMELLNDLVGIANLQFSMILDYTDKVAKLKVNNADSNLVKDVVKYIQSHLSDAIKTDDIARSLYVSRSHLSTKFKQETGITLTEFILNQKILEAKRLLRYSNKPISDIANFLGFSNQSHFTRVFKEKIGITPKEYILKHRH